MNYAIVGQGRMGRAIDALAGARGHRRVAVVDPGAPGFERGVGGLAELGARVAFEFTTPRAAEANVVALLTSGVAVVCGTTGWRSGAAVQEAAARGGVGAVIAPNFSVGMSAFFRVTAVAARLFAALDLHEASIHETHHRAKADIPSGTARRLAAIVMEGDPRIERICEGHPQGPLPPRTLQVVGTRVGYEPGTHTVHFDGEHDRVTLCHAARSRDGFAWGAVRAAEWIVSQQGVHTFEDVIDEILSRHPATRDKEGGTP